MSLESLFEQYTGVAPVSCVALTGSASHRRYYRLTGADGQTLIGVEGTDADENRAFLTIDRHFASKGILVPKVVAVDGLCYLQEDLGSTVLYDALAAGRASGQYGPEEVALLRKTLAALPKIQVEGARGLDFSVCYPQPSFDARMVDFDLNYFKYDFLKLSGLEFNEVLLQDDFDRLKADLLAEPSETFLYRDFNARNVMLVDGEPYFIDFQGGRRGPVYYDVASFLWQARARYPEALREELLQVYLDVLRAYGPVDEAHFRDRLRLFILFRMLQVLGCYGYRGLWERNQSFIDSIPPALEIVKSLLPLADYPYLSEVLASLCGDALSPEGVLFPKPSAIGDFSTPPSAPLEMTKAGPCRSCEASPSSRPSGASLSSRPSGASPSSRPSEVSLSFRPSEASLSFRPSEASLSFRPSEARGEISPLTVTVYSFSYKKGIPEDISGNGGGYVFDCRSVHNPGKYERFKQLTGLDAPVIEFLEQDGEILRFLGHVYALVDAHVERFLQRGFTHLQVSFGCTGGQHRSAYSAQHLAEHLVAKYPVKVHLIHRERGIERWLPEEPSNGCD
jgi:aminoglycoside/choline kinase family phosphotransferase